MNTYNPNFQKNLEFGQDAMAWQPYTPAASAAAAPVAMNALQTGLSYASPLVGIAGTAIGAYGAIQQANQAEEALRESQRQFELEKQRLEKIDEENRRQKELENIMGFGTYAKNTANNAADQYGAYARKVGL